MLVIWVLQNSAIYQYISTVPVHSDTQVFFVYMYSCCFWGIVLMLFILFVCFFMVNTPCRISFNLVTMQLSKIWLLYMHLKTTTLYMQNEENLVKQMETEITCNEIQVYVNLKKQTWTKTKINFTNVQINFLTENEFFNCCICLFGFFLSHLRIFHSYGDVTITREGPYSALMSTEQWGFFDRYPFIIALNLPHVRWTF